MTRATADTRSTLGLSAVAYAVPEGWMGVCLERWLFAQAESQAKLCTELERVIFAHVEIAGSKNRDPFDYLPAAPQRFRDLFNTAGAVRELADLFIRFPGDEPAPLRLVVRVTEAKP